MMNSCLGCEVTRLTTMAEMDIKRSIRFVSLDTHPANNAIVITYEILIRVVDPKNEREITRRSKRDQFQIHISALDKLTKGDRPSESDSGVFDLRKLSEQILERCPFLLDEDNSARAFEEIQLNLLYLYNRRQAQLSQPPTSRPPSSARFKSGRMSRAGSATPRASNEPSPQQNTGSSPLDIYTRLCERHLEVISGRIDREGELLSEFMARMDAHSDLGVREVPLDAHHGADLDSQLDGFYGDWDEKLRSIGNIRRNIREDDERLLATSSNVLLVCAMLKTLRDSEGVKHRLISESILYCLIRLTSFDDTLERVLSSTASAGDSLDLVKVVIDLFRRHEQSLSASQGEDPKRLISSFYYTNSLLIILSNVVKLSQSTDARNRSRRMLVQKHGNELADALVDLLVLLAKHVPHDLRTPGSERYERLTITIRLVLSIGQQLITLKEFIGLLRTGCRAKMLVESTITLLNALQLCRPGSGGTQQNQQRQQQLVVGDEATHVEVYELELELLGLITSLVQDARLKARFMRKNLLLKCVLRNLVVFLAASRQSATMNPFDRCPVLMIPFKCLYELSRSDKIKHELFRSKIIMKCLLEYLLSSGTDLKAELESAQFRRENEHSASTNLDLNEDDQIVLRPQNAGQIIVCFWLNLSARTEAPIYHLSDGNEELKEPLCDYIQLVATNLKIFVQLVTNSSLEAENPRRPPTRSAHLSVYVHAKLLRNLSHFIKFGPNESLIEILAHASHLILGLVPRRPQEFVPLTVEILAALANCVERSSVNQDEPILACPPHVEQVLGQLFGEGGQLARGFSPETENDDLLLVSINLLGTLGQNREICAEIKPIHWGIVNLMTSTINMKQSDTEMLISCLFTLRQLTNHSGFLQELGLSLEQSEQRSVALVDALSMLILHADVSVVKLANLILNILKQFEELQSLSESVTCQRRFQAYNRKWLTAMRANRDEPKDAQEVDEGHRVDQYLGGSDEGTSHQDDSDGLMDLDFNQLRTINEVEVQSSSSSRLSTTSLREAKNVPGLRGDKKRHGSDAEEDEMPDGIGDEDDDDEEETFSEPDLNVIDANSMIKHLTNRREIRTELLRR